MGFYFKRHRRDNLGLSASRIGAQRPLPRSHRQQAWKRQVLAREIESEEIDTAPFRDRYGPNSVQITPQAAE